MHDRDRRARHMRWDGGQLRLTTGRLLAIVEPDPDWPNMWRVHMPDGHVSDMVNRTRAKDAAISLALEALNPERAAA
jgi:hypothetical protein